jgi:hypothetical protein
MTLAILPTVSPLAMLYVVFSAKKKAATKKKATKKKKGPLGGGVTHKDGNR